MRNKARQVFQARWVWLGILAAALLLGVRLQDAWEWNARAQFLLKGQAEAIIDVAPGCAHIWLTAAQAGKRGNLAAERNAWQQALACSPDNVSLLEALFPQDGEMALLATQTYSENSKAWFWLGETLAPTDPLVARQAYLRTVALAPSNGLAWCRLGVNYDRDSEFEKASASFLNCCFNGDPGSNGCYGAGRMMEKLGDPQKAIEYYRLSRWEGALNRAKELEKP